MSFIQTGDSQVVGLLLLHGADTDIVDNYGATASDYAAQIGDHETQLLLLNSANERAVNASPEWVECFDEETGYPFWVNTTTGETEVSRIFGAKVAKGLAGCLYLMAFRAFFVIEKTFVSSSCVGHYVCSGAKRRCGRTTNPKYHKSWK